MSQFKIPITFIKNIAIPLSNDYQLSNNPFKVNKKCQRYFIGREEEIEKFQGFMNAKTKNGVFLVTGYRGMGKTSFVNYVIKEYLKASKNHKKIIHIPLTIAQNSLKETEVLKQVVSSIYDRFGNKKNKMFDLLYAFRYLIIAAALVVFGLKIVFKLLDSKVCTFVDWIDFSTITYFLIPLLLLVLFEKIVLYRNKAFKRIKDLMDRCFSEVTDEKSTDTNISLIKELRLNFGYKRNKKYNIANSKEIEYELSEFLGLAKKEGYEFIFVFDELDKIEFSNDQKNINEDMDSFEAKFMQNTSSNLIRNRKQAVLNIITGLKNFFTTADARFIFIAGREMFDASLADISDKQSPLSSIFTYTFHIETLLKEKGKSANFTSLSVAIEDFLKMHIFDAYGSTKSFDDLVKENYGHCENYLQIYHVLQGFITYLIYRSSGSPKKLIKAFQEFIKFNAFITNYNSEFLIVPNKTEADKYLYFNTSEQYRIGFINSIYRPFIIQYGKSYKSFSENSVISIPYYFDHLFKFHPFAFSLSNLELIPDLIAINKTPNMKDDINQVIHYLLQSHIRNTDIELFDYKFHSKTANEITYLSKIFETEEAAFNFTLDESFPAKMILVEKIKEYRSIHSKYNIDHEKLNPQIFSIATLNSSLGDIYFFDQEFHEAISCYSDAIRAINNLKPDRINFRDFIGLIRNKLKLGLCFEKIYSFEEALSFYSDSVQDIKRFYNHYIQNAGYFDDTMYYHSRSDFDKAFHTSSLNDLLQICIQSFLANIFIQEKMGQEGITTSRVKAEFSDFYRIVDHITEHSGRNHIIIANCMLHQGKLLFYKNSSSNTFDYIKQNVNDYPGWIKNRSEKLNEIFKLEDYNVRRQPILAMMTYFIGLDEIMKSRPYFIKYFKLPKDEQKNDDDLLIKNIIFNSSAKRNRKDFMDLYLNAIHDFIISENKGEENFIANHYRYMASFLSSIGDCLLSLNDVRYRKTKIKKASLKYKIYSSDIFHQDLTNKGFMDGIISHEQLSINDVLKCYFLSAQLYEHYGQMTCAHFEYQKIIQTLSNVIINEGKDYKRTNIIIDYLDQTIIRKCKDLYYNSIGQSHIHIHRKTDGNLKSTIANPNNNYEYIFPNQPMIKEVLLHFENLKLELYMRLKISYKDIRSNYATFKLLKDANNDIINTNYSVSSQHLRVLELEINSRRLQKAITDIIKDKKRPKTFEQYKNDIVNFVYDKTSILRIFRIYGSDYIFGPGWNAHMHYKLAQFLEQEIEGKKIATYLEEDTESKKRVEKLIGGKSQSVCDIEYHYRKALNYYNIAIQLHTAGQEYRKQMREMVYLEDDFNDHSYHFGAALERYHMINDVFKIAIKDIGEKIQNIEKEKIDEKLKIHN